MASFQKYPECTPKRLTLGGRGTIARASSSYRQRRNVALALSPTLGMVRENAHLFETVVARWFTARKMFNMRGDKPRERRPVVLERDCVHQVALLVC